MHLSPSWIYDYIPQQVGLSRHGRDFRVRPWVAMKHIWSRVVTHCRVEVESFSLDCISKPKQSVVNQEKKGGFSRTRTHYFAEYINSGSHMGARTSLPRVQMRPALGKHRYRLWAAVGCSSSLAEWQASMLWLQMYSLHKKLNSHERRWMINIMQFAIFPPLCILG